MDICEKALNEYLETKRRAFPRFYFVARTDLLDILSKATKPREVMKHLPKIYGAIQSLVFAVDEDIDVNIRYPNRTAENEATTCNKFCFQ